MYSLGGVNLNTLGLILIKQDSSDLAISGFIDMPERLGTTSYSWSIEDGEEPYVSAEDIAIGGFGGRDIKLMGLITGSEREEISEKLESYYSLIDSFTGLVPLVTDYGTFQVYVNSPIVGDFMPAAGNILGVKVTTTFREPLVNLNGIIPVANNANNGIDGISFEDLGCTFLELNGDRYNRPATKSINTTVYGREGFTITKTIPSELSLKLYIKQPTYLEFKSKIQSLMALFSSPGIRKLNINKDQPRNFYVKSGFKVTNIYSLYDGFVGILECALTEVNDVVTKLSQAINFPAIPIKQIDADDFTPQISITSGLPITLTSSNESVAVVLIGNIIHITGIGQSVITASQPGNEQYDAATSKIQVLRVTDKNNQFTYTFPYTLS